MKARRTRLAVAAGALALAVLVAEPAGAMIYSLADDYSSTVNTNSSMWSYRGKGDLNRDGNYGLLPTSTIITGGIKAWVGSGGLPLVGKNDTGATVTSGTFSLPNGAALMHPSLAGLSVSSWLAPSNMTVHLKYQFSDADPNTLPNGDNGIRWFVERNSQGSTLDLGGFAAGGDSGPRILNNISVSAGDRINFVVDPNGAGATNYYYDSTKVDARISTDPWPIPKIISFDINGRDTNDPPVSPTYSGAAAIGSAGDFWNSVQVTNATVPSVTVSDLKLTDGTTPTTARFTVSRAGSGPANLAADIITDSHGPNALLQDYFYTHSAGAGAPTRMDFTIDGLIPGALYDLYLYGTAGDYSNQSQFTIGGVTKTAAGGVAGFIEGASYVRFQSLTAVGGQIDGTVLSPSGYAVFDGFQISGAFAVVPEPATLVLLGGAVLSLMRRRR